MKKILDHGSLELVEHWGSDERIIEAARMSTNKGFQGWGPKTCDCEKNVACNKCKGTGKIPGDEKLLKYLWENKHATPFEMAGMVIEIKAPIMVFREWHRHRTQSYNELSARYTPLPNENYLPTIERLMVSGGVNKQASGIVEGLTEQNAKAWLIALEQMYYNCEQLYQAGLRAGIPKELARLIVPVGRYSKMRAAANLRNWLAFLTLRMDSKAQFEIRMYANAIGELIEQLFPRTWSLYQLGRKDASS